MSAENNVNVSKGVEQFLKLEVLLDNHDNQEYILKSKTDFLWEYAKNVENFLSNTFAEDNLPEEQNSSYTNENTDIQTKMPDLNNLTTNQKLIGVVLIIGIGYIVYTTNKKKKITKGMQMHSIPGTPINPTMV